MARESSDSAGMDFHRKVGAQGRMPGNDRIGLDRYATAKPSPRAEEAKNPHAAKPTAIDGVDREECSPGPSLVERLSSGRHPVEAALRPEKTATALKACIDHDRVRVRFVDTQGPTELGMKLDKATSDIRSADFEHATGAVHLEGDLTLDDVKVRCIVDLDLATLCGEGYLLRRGQ